MTAAVPPPAKLVELERQGESWCCYYCERFFTRADFSELQERETWRCEACGQIQVLGTSELVRQAALEADAQADVVGKRGEAPPPSPPMLSRRDRHSIDRLSRSLNRPRSPGKQTPLPEHLDPKILEKVQSAYDDCIKRNGKPSHKLVADFARVNRTTVGKYWAFVQK